MTIKRNLPAIQDRSFKEQRNLNDGRYEAVEEGRVEKLTKMNLITIVLIIMSAIGTITTVSFVIGGKNSDITNGLEANKNSINALARVIEKGNEKTGKRMDQMQNLLMVHNSSIVETKTKISALEKKTETIESRQYQSRKRKRR